MSLRRDLERARQSFVLTTELHLTFLCVPVTEALTVDWMRFCNMMGGLQVGAGSGGRRAGGVPSTD